jgi:hypothetical protein
MGGRCSPSNSPTRSNSNPNVGDRSSWSPCSRVGPGESAVEARAAGPVTACHAISHKAPDATICKKAGAPCCRRGFAGESAKRLEKALRPTDRRSVLVELTAAGTPTVEELCPPPIAVEEACMAGLSSIQLDTLVQLLTIVQRTIRARRANSSMRDRRTRSVPLDSCASTRSVAVGALASAWGRRFGCIPGGRGGSGRLSG